MCEVDTHKAQLTIKFVNISLAVVDFMVAASDETKAHPITAKVVSKVLPVVAQLAAGDRLVTQLDSHALVIDNGWSVHLEDLKGAAKNFSDVQSFIHSGWKRRGHKLLDSSDIVLPDKVLVTSKLLLTSESHLKSLRSAIANVVAGKFLMLVSEALVALNKFTDGGGELPPDLKQVQKALIKARRSGKIAISVDWAIGQIQGFQPTNGEGMVTYARNVLVKCKSKGVSRDDESMPKFLHSFLDGMVKKGLPLQPALAPSVGAADDICDVEVKGGAEKVQDVSQKPASKKRKAA